MTIMQASYCTRPTSFSETKLQNCWLMFARTKRHNVANIRCPTHISSWQLLLYSHSQSKCPRVNSLKWCEGSWPPVSQEKIQIPASLGSLRLCSAEVGAKSPGVTSRRPSPDSHFLLHDDDRQGRLCAADSFLCDVSHIFGLFVTDSRTQ